MDADSAAGGLACDVHVHSDYSDGTDVATMVEAAFDYAIGSVHHAGRRNVVVPGEFADDTDEERTAFVGDYFDLVVELIESELFDVAAHLDLTELNAGRALADYGEIHPHPAFLDVLRAAGVRFVAGTDAHAPEELGARAEFLSEVLAARDVELVDPR